MKALQWNTEVSRAHVSLTYQGQPCTVPLDESVEGILPHTVLRLIFRELLDLDRKALAACCRCSHLFWTIASPILYRRIQFTVDPKSDSRHVGAQTARFEPLLNVVITKRKRKLLAHARVLTIDAHWNDMCDQHNLDLSAVSTLNICPLASSDHSLGPILHVSPGVTKECAILKNVKPKKLVFDTTFLNCLNPFPRGLPKDIYDHIEELVYICPSSSWRPDSPKREDFPRMPQLKRLVLMFYTPDLKNHWQQGEIRTALDLSRIVKMFWNLQDVPMIVVNGGSLYAHMVDVRPWTESAVQTALKSTLEMDLSFQPYQVQSDWVETTADDPKGHAIFSVRTQRAPRYRKANDTPETRARESADKLKLDVKKGRLQFLTMKEYLRAYVWEGELSPDEVYKWLATEDQAQPTKRAKSDTKQSARSSSQPQTANQSSFPREVLNQIFSALFEVDRASLTACCLASRPFFEIAAPIMYRHVVVSPSFVRDSRIDLAPDRYTDTGREKNTTRKKKLLKAAEIVTIDHHHATWCGNKSFKYPKLKTLVLNMTQNGLGSVLHADDILEKQCSYAKGQAPKKLVLKRIHLCRVSSDMLGVPEKLFDTIEELTFICPITDIKPGSMAGDFGPMQKTKKLVWIFDTPDPRTRWTLGTRTMFGRESPGLEPMDLFSFTYLIKNLPDVPFYIVNAGSIDHKYFNLEKWNERDVRDKFIDMVKDGPLFGCDGENDRAEYTKKLARINFLTMREYIENHDWSGELEPKQVKAFLA
ncbi:hypothetical protein I316_05814 [Kwoniella heveanensis BCC8398]|uniref:Uncharacterized protein n=1 Tax=Kwoniella heveanensis BCC8398 TaxID=1296120 RepID=A0A1B9GNE4_9TREE|nr:hypothetical protein I316_05814 [Kwoniella heveanensis BCC8398]